MEREKEQNSNLRMHTYSGMEVWIYQAALAVLFSIVLEPLAWAVDATGSMNRSSAQPLPPPDFIRTHPSDHFTLPPLPEAESNSLDRRIFPIKQIVIEGGNVFPEAHLRALAQPYEERDAFKDGELRIRINACRPWAPHHRVRSPAV